MASVSRGRGSVRWKPEYAKQVLREWYASGLSITEFARDSGYPVKRLWNWSGRLRKRGWVPEGSEAGCTDDGLLLPVRVIDRLSTRAVSPIEVELPNGLLVRVCNDFDDSALTRVVNAVSRC
jgi:hypothetical protein